MKEITSVSLGSSKRDHQVEVEFLGEKFKISRVGTDGSFQKAFQLLEELDGKVDAIGLGGIDIYLHSGTKRYILKDGMRLAQSVKKTPVVDGSGLKGSLERETVKYLNKVGFQLQGKKVLMASAVDRIGMAEAFVDAGCKMVFGDLIFALGIDKPINSLEILGKIADELLPKICDKPFDILYPIGKEQDKEPKPKFTKYYQEAEIIAGDYLYIRKYMPSDMRWKWIVTNTTTPKDVQDLRKRKVEYLITTTPKFKGRSFGTNVLEAVLVALLDKPWEEITEKEYLDLIKKLDLKPRIEKLN